MSNQRIICHSIIDFPGVEAYQVKFHLWRSHWSDSVSDVVIFIRLCDMEMWWLVFISPPYYLRLNVQSLMVHSTLSMLCKFLLSLSWILEASAFIRWSNHVEMEEAQNLFWTFFHSTCEWNSKIWSRRKPIKFRAPNKDWWI